MALIIIILLIIIIFLLAHIFYMEKQIRYITNQLIDINHNKVDKKVTIGLLNDKIENLTKAINETIEKRKQCEGSKIKLKTYFSQSVANMSHDLRTPLTSIKGYIQLLRLDGISESEKNEYLRIAEERTKALESLLNDFYDLSLIDSLDFELKLEKINISDILKEVLVEKYADFNNRDLQPEINIAEDNLYIIAETKSLERVIENLLSNTIKYTKDKARVYLGTENDMAILRISNTFTNLKSEDVEKIFDRFYMADKNRSGKGTGLGLAIVKELVEKMNGSISADIEHDVLSICCKFNII